MKYFYTFIYILFIVTNHFIAGFISKVISWQLIISRQSNVSIMYSYIDFLLEFCLSSLFLPCSE